MCTSIIEIARAEGMAKRGEAWFPLSHRGGRLRPRAPRAARRRHHARLHQHGARRRRAGGVELTLETAKELRAALDRAIAAAEFEEAEVRGKGAPLSLVARGMTDRAG